MTVRIVACRWFFVALMLGIHAGAPAETLASFDAGDAEILLMTEPCGAKGSRLQRAQKRTGGASLDGCWAVNARGNPVAMWSDGEVQELDQGRVRLSPKFAAMLDDADAPRAASADFPRPAWCASARFPHERLVCRDRELAAADLALAPLWRAYRTGLKLNPVQQGRQKSDYFRRLKACGAKKACIAREQAAQARLYRRALGR